jgi:ornithine carbamoyltransferase
MTLSTSIPPVAATAATAAMLACGAPAELGALLGQVRAMRVARRAEGASAAPLRGRNVGLLCGGEPGEAAALFTRAATALGARVARLSPELVAAGVRNEPAVGRVLGRLYDAIECQAVPVETVSRLRRAAGVPVYDGLATAAQPSAALAPMLGLSSDEVRELVVQAALVAALDGV